MWEAGHYQLHKTYQLSEDLLEQTRNFTMPCSPQTTSVFCGKLEFFTCGVKTSTESRTACPEAKFCALLPVMHGKLSYHFNDDIYFRHCVRPLCVICKSSLVDLW